MALYLVQHGKNLPKDQDPHKGLSSEGRQEVRRIARVAADYGVNLSEIWHSGKTRAYQTADLIAGILKPEGKIIQMQGLGPLDDVAEFASKLDLDSDTMVVGHLPFLEKLVTYMVFGTTSPPVFKLQNGGILCLDRYPGTGDPVIKWAIMPVIK